MRISSPVAFDSVRMCGPKAAERSIALLCRRLAQTRDRRVDPKLMLQILLNLVSNAMKFSHQDGRVDNIH